MVDAIVEDRPNNTVRVKFDIKEGDRAKIRQVNIVGNTAFDDEEIRDGFELDTANWLSWFRQDDRYSSEALEGDLERLRSYYMDRGYADFRIDSTQVAISPNKKDIYVTIGIHEGDLYTIADIKLVGEMVVRAGAISARAGHRKTRVGFQSESADPVRGVYVPAARRARLCECRDRTGP